MGLEGAGRGEEALGPALSTVSPLLDPTGLRDPARAVIIPLGISVTLPVYFEKSTEGIHSEF